MRKFLLICTLTIGACTVMAPAAEALKYRPITAETVVGNCGLQLQFGVGAMGCTICNDSGSKCTDYACVYAPQQGGISGCNAVSFIAKRGQSSLRATPMQFWPPGWLNRAVTR
jgi:hypothetical protein